jgi:hypothetical protein
VRGSLETRLVPVSAKRVGILILAGGEATRLPGKLALAAGDVPLVARVYRNFARPGRETFLAASGTFAPELDALLPVPAVIDRWSRRGPLGGMLSTMARMRSRYVFAVAGDAPFVTPELLTLLLGNSGRVTRRSFPSGTRTVSGFSNRSRRSTTGRPSYAKAYPFCAADAGRSNSLSAACAPASFPSRVAARSRTSIRRPSIPRFSKRCANRTRDARGTAGAMPGSLERVWRSNHVPGVQSKEFPWRSSRRSI